MSASQPPTTDAPFNLQPNVAAGLAYLFSIIGGIVMLVGGGTNKFVKFSAAQSITLWAVFVIAQIAIMVLAIVLHPLGYLLPLLYLAGFVFWIWAMITAFQGKETHLPVVGQITESVFKSAL